MEKKTGLKSRGSLLFLLVVAVLYAIAFLLDAKLAVAALELTGELLYQLIPILVIVFVLIFISNLLVHPDWVRAHVGKKSGIRGWAIAVVGGVLSVGPVYPWYALLRELRDHGMRTALIAVFLYNRGIKLPLLPLMVHYFGMAFTVVLVIYLTLFSLLSGLIMEKIADHENC